VNAPWNGHDTRVLVVAVIGIGIIVALIVVWKVHAFLALTIGALFVGLGSGIDAGGVTKSYENGVGSVLGYVGVLIALGAMVGKLLADSGGADQVVDTLLRGKQSVLPWKMALIAAIIGIPMFFEIGLVLLVPVVVLAIRRTGARAMLLGIPALAGLSVLHGFIPPHPGPLAAIGVLGGNVGITLALGLLVAIPTVIVAGPLFGRIAGRWVDVSPPHTFDASDRDESAERPSFGITLFSVLLPVVLMLGKALVDIFIDDEEQRFRQVFDVLGTPLIALLIAVLVAMYTLGVHAGMERKDVAASVEAGLPPIAGILLIVAAGGGFKQVLVDTGVGTVLADWAKDADISVLLLAWVLAVLIRLATGSATVATITASSLMIGLVDGLSTGETSLVVLAVGSGSVFFSHVNDAGFWLVKEYFGMSVGQTIKSWSLMETVLSVTGLVFVLLLGIVI
jgi:GntP family gluconate:H+ symporter